MHMSIIYIYIYVYTTLGRKINKIKKKNISKEIKIYYTNVG